MNLLKYDIEPFFSVPELRNGTGLLAMLYNNQIGKIYQYNNNLYIILFGYNRVKLLYDENGKLFKMDYYDVTIKDVKQYPHLNIKYLCKQICKLEKI